MTHDYLVPALRQWLTRKQRETRQGRMELLLTERVSGWSVKQDSRQLPGRWEWLDILLWTRSRNRTPPQRRMLRAATRRYLLQAVVLVAVASLFGWLLAEVYRGPVKADHLVESLKTADIEQVEQIIEDLDTRRRWADPKLRAVVDDPRSSPKAKLHAGLALLPVDGGQVPFLEDELFVVGPDEAMVIARRLLAVALPQGLDQFGVLFRPLGGQGRMGLLTVLEHEPGHRPDRGQEADGVMQATLTAGKRLPVRGVDAGVAPVFVAPDDAGETFDPVNAWREG